jgi:hypothetical protein
MTGSPSPPRKKEKRSEKMILPYLDEIEDIASDSDVDPHLKSMIGNMPEIRMERDSHIIHASSSNDFTIPAASSDEPSQKDIFLVKKTSEPQSALKRSGIRQSSMNSGTLDYNLTPSLEGSRSSIAKQESPSMGISLEQQDDFQSSSSASLSRAFEDEDSLP